MAETVLATATITGPEARGTAALIQTDDGRTLLRATDYWIADGAPDARFYLTPHPGGSVDVEGIIDFGKITPLTGNIEFDLPTGADPSSFLMVVVYCRQYSVEFGRGSLH